MTAVFALIGAKALYLLYVWLASGIICSFLSARKGYGEKAGLATGLLTSVVGVVIWLVWPAKHDSSWKLQGAIPRRGGDSLSAKRAELEHDAESETRA